MWLCFRYFEINLGNGVVERIQRERALLKEGSIPLKYPNCPSYLSSAASKRKSPKTRTAKSPKQNKITNDSSVRTKLKIKSCSSYIYIFCYLLFSYGIFQSTETVSIVQNVNETSIVNFLPTVPNFDDSSLSTVRNIDNFPATVENLNKFIKIIDTRGLPLGWTYSVLPKGIAFLYWTENYHSVLRRFVIYSDGGDSKVFLGFFFLFTRLALQQILLKYFESETSVAGFHFGEKCSLQSI